jgi:hypothetical protein
VKMSELDAVRKLRKAMLRILESASKYDLGGDYALRNDIEDGYDAMLSTASLDVPQQAAPIPCAANDETLGPMGEKPVAWRIFRSDRWCFAYAPSRNLNSRGAWEPLYPAAALSKSCAARVNDEIAKIRAHASSAGLLTIIQHCEAATELLTDTSMLNETVDGSTKQDAVPVADAVRSLVAQYRESVTRGGDSSHTRSVLMGKIESLITRESAHGMAPLDVAGAREVA